MKHSHLPVEIRARLKRLCPYVGRDIPDSVKENARHVFPYGLKYAGWQWEQDGGEHYQCELELCDMDADTIDPAGYVAIRPIGQNKYALIFVICAGWAKGFDPEELVFPSMQEAQHFLDRLLAAETPAGPFLIPFPR
jgi:hypothetical protein